jgi:hypothetical protein
LFNTFKHRFRYASCFWKKLIFSPRARNKAGIAYEQFDYFIDFHAITLVDRHCTCPHTAVRGSANDEICLSPHQALNLNEAGPASPNHPAEVVEAEGLNTDSASEDHHQQQQRARPVREADSSVIQL